MRDPHDYNMIRPSSFMDIVPIQSVYYCPIFIHQFETYGQQIRLKMYFFVLVTLKYIYSINIGLLWAYFIIWGTILDPFTLGNEIPPLCFGGVDSSSTPFCFISLSS